MANKKLQIRNSTVEFLIFTSQAGENGIEVRFQNETIWLSQKMMAVCSTGIGKKLASPDPDGHSNRPPLYATRIEIVTVTKICYLYQRLVSLK